MLEIFLAFLWLAAPGARRAAPSCAGGRPRPTESCVKKELAFGREWAHDSSWAHGAPEPRKELKMSEFTFTRNFTRRDDDSPFATIRVSALVESIMIEDRELPADSIEYLLNFAFQCLQDAYAGAKTRAECHKLYSKKLTKLLDGTIAEREVDPVVRVGRAILTESLKKNHPAKWKELAALDAKERNTLLDQVLSENAEKLQDAIAERIAAEKAAKARSRSIKVELGDIL